MLWRSSQLTLAFPVIVLELGLLGVLYLRLGIGLGLGSPLETWLVEIPVSLFLVCANLAFIVNLAAMSAFLQVGNGILKSDAWVFILIDFAAIPAAFICLKRMDIAYALGMLGALAQIYFRPDVTALLRNTALSAQVLIALALMGGWYLRKQRFNNV